MRRLLIICIMLTICICQNPAFADHSGANYQPIIYDATGQSVQLLPGEYAISHAEMKAGSFHATDEINMIQIATLPGPMYTTMSGGDSDEDGLFETYMYIKDNVGGWTYTYRIYENDGQNNYDEVFNAGQGLIPYAFGDTDGDDLPEVIGQWSYWLYVWESPSSGELATNMVWQSPQLYNVTGYTTIGDLDQDGFGEIIHTQNSFGSDNRLVIYESTGNNQYQEVYNQQISNNNLGSKAVADFDMDDLWEVAFSSGGGDVYVFESTGINTVSLTYHGNMNTWNAYACCLANDMDGNGRLEFICGGSDSNRGWVTQVYEADGNDSYVMRQEIIVWDGYFGSPGVTAGDYNGDGIDEFVIQGNDSLYIYAWNGIEYSLDGIVGENFGSILHGVCTYDGNDNGWDDIFWLGLGDGGYWTNSTINLESENAGVYPDVTISLTPYNPPITIPANGGSFDFNIMAMNNETTAQTVTVWSDVLLPTGNIFGPLIGPVIFDLVAGTSVERDRTQNVPASAPEGMYSYNAYVGVYPDIIWDQDSFNFEKLSDFDDDTHMLDNWACTGESLEKAGKLKTIEPVEISIQSTIFPNPFNQTTTISYSLPQASDVRIHVYDTSGRLLDSLADSWHEAGNHIVNFGGSGLPSGIYFLQLSSDSQDLIEKIILIK